MMVDALPAAGIPGAVNGAANRASVTREQFLRILVAELTSQNPLDPLDNAEFMQQLVGLQSLEQTAALTDSLHTFQRFMEMSSGSALIGRTVRGTAPDGTVVEGVVSRVILDGNRVSVIVGSHALPLSAVQEVRKADEEPDAA